MSYDILALSSLWALVGLFHRNTQKLRIAAAIFGNYSCKVLHLGRTKDEEAASFFDAHSMLAELQAFLGYDAPANGVLTVAALLDAASGEPLRVGEFAVASHVKRSW